MQLLLSHELQAPGATRLSPADLRARMEERFAWALGQGHAVSVLACETLGLERIELQDPGLSPSVLGALALALEPAFHASEAVVEVEGRSLLVLLVVPDPDRIPAACKAWIEGARKLRIEGRNGLLGLSLTIGYGFTQPGKRLFLDTLIQVARESLRVARCRGAGACVQTMLYDMLQDRLEEERGTKGILVKGDAVKGGAVKGGAPLPPAAASPAAQWRAAGSMSFPQTPARELTETELRQRQLSEALDAQRRENDELRAQLRALETREELPEVGSRQEAPADASENPQERQRIELLERRLAKLMLSLEEAEQRLSRVSRLSVDDPGIASCYRTVQGLETDAPLRSLKAALMERIFQANLELREHFQGLRQTPPEGLGPGTENNGGFAVP